ncbi:hypothetical protein EAG_11598 [Camponotus floridanus]|uniref:Uncharacterized protein n=1 Tax=Camponotus floridanus TaxID=104421 RepID=E2A4K7_CAMFO|nr:hypothetical protein EAG_11598 [Camponotus floridanus]
MHSPGALRGDMPVWGWKYEELTGKIPQGKASETKAFAALIASRIDSRVLGWKPSVHYYTPTRRRLRGDGIGGSFLRAIRVLITSFLSTELRGYRSMFFVLAKAHFAPEP